MQAPTVVPFTILTPVIIFCCCCVFFGMLFSVSEDKKLLVLKVNVQFHDFQQLFCLPYVYKHRNAVSFSVFFLNRSSQISKRLIQLRTFSLNNQPNSRPELLTAQWSVERSGSIWHTDTVYSMPFILSGTLQSLLLPPASLMIISQWPGKQNNIISECRYPQTMLENHIAILSSFVLSIFNRERGRVLFLT